MTNRNYRLLAAILLAVVFLAAFVPTGSFILQYAPVQATFASTSYTSTQTATSTPVDLGRYGSIQIQTSVVVTGSQVTTIVPQFSNELVPCSLVSTWVTATEQVIYTAALSGTTSAPTMADVLLSYSLTGSTADNREMIVLGRCFRLSITSTGTFTPTGYLRFLMRN